MRMNVVTLLLGVAVAVAACSGSKDPRAAASSAAAPAAPPVAPLPDVGRLEQIPVSTQGSGESAQAAVQDALRLAVMEVNGESMTAGSLGVKFGLDLPFIKKIGSLHGAASADALVSGSHGFISSFKLVSIDEPGLLDGRYKAHIEASIAKFGAPADAARIRIAVSPLHVSADVFDVGGTEVPAAGIAEEVRRQLIDALAATGRFSVVDRDFGPEVRAELELVSSGQTRTDERAKLSQALSADLVWVGAINDFSYRRKLRHLRMSDRDLVSYSGAWSVSQRVLNVATRQIMLSDTLQQRWAPDGATTLAGDPPAQSAAGACAGHTPVHAGGSGPDHWCPGCQVNVSIHPRGRR